MNLMPIILSNDEFKSKNIYINKKIEKIKNLIKQEKTKFKEEPIYIGNTQYYKSCLPIISKERDVLTKPTEICKIFVNWKNKDFTGMKVNDICNELKAQYAFSIAIVDAEHTRNKFKNKTIIWAVFDSEELAKKNMRIFNSMFITAIEQDAINEYKKFKENPEKRPLTFDKLVPNAYKLYNAIDKGEL